MFSRPLRHAVLAVALTFAAGSAYSADKPLTIGVSAGPYGDILRETAKLAAKDGLAAAQALALALRLGRSLSSGMSEGSGGCGLASSCSSSICALRGGALPGRQRS